MGWDLPAAIGAAVADPARKLVCLAGDGSILMNIQELQTIVNHRLPVKIFVFNNDGYLSIKLTQTNFFHGRYVGCHPASGVSFPEIERIAQLTGCLSGASSGTPECAKRLPRCSPWKVRRYAT